MISPVLELVHVAPVNCQPDASTIRRTFQVRAALESRLGREIAMGRDANLAALAEYRLGLGRQLRIAPLCVLTLGPGVAGSIFLMAQLWEGANGISGEGAHVIV